jgi:hypothetical protein
MDQDRRRGKSLFQSLKAFSRFICPCEGTEFPALFYSFQEVCQAHGYLRVTVDKPVIEIGKSKKYLDVMERFWFWLFNNTADPFRIRTNTFCSDKEAQKFDFLDVKLAFAEFTKQVIFT